jgi:methyl-accepting chemotaxis protein
MSQQTQQTTRRRLFALPVRISLGLVFAAILPLLVLLVFTNLQTRPALLDQANKAMDSDAQTRVQLIDTYFDERTADVLTLTQVPSVQQFLQLPPPPTTDMATYQTAAAHALYSLQAGILRDTNYRNWALFTLDGKPLLNAPDGTPPAKHGDTYITAAYLAQIRAGSVFVTPVYGSADNKEATVDIYGPITEPATAAQPKPTNIIGFMRATLKLNYVWERVVQRDLGVNGSGSYAFILDEDGIRIADTDQARRFTSVETLSPDLQQQMRTIQRFSKQQDVTALPDPRVATSRQQDTSSDTFQTQPAGQSQPFQVVRQSTTSKHVHWQYFVLSPVSTVTAVADRELLSITLVAALASLLVALLGWFVGRGMAHPILRAVGNLRESSSALAALATNQQDAATEQMWVVDSSQVGVQSVQYYTDAARVALRELQEVATTLAHHWRQGDPQRIEQALERILKATNYLENAMEFQNASNQKLATALKVANQVTEQLHQGALSATEAAAQLEDVVQRLLAVAGGK